MKGYPEPHPRLTSDGCPRSARRGAQRIAFHLLAVDHADVRRLADTLIEVTERVPVLPDLQERGRSRRVPDLPGSPARPTAICVVEEPKDVAAVEKIREFAAVTTCSEER